MTLKSMCTFATVLLLGYGPAIGQLVAKPDDLQEYTTIKLSSTLTLSGPWRCDQRGTLYTREPARTMSSAKLFRIAADGSLDPTFSTDVLATTIFIDDYAPDNNGEITAVGFLLAAPYNSRVVHLGSNGSVVGDVPLAGPPDFVPLRIAVFTDGTLLAMGTFVSPSQPNKDNLSWFTGIFRKNGALIREVAFDLTTLSTDFDIAAPFVSGGLAMPYKEWKPLTSSLSIVSSANNHVIITLPRSTALPSFGRNTSYLDVASDGTFVNKPLPGPAASELFASVGVPGGLLAVWGKMGSTIDEMRRYNLDGPLDKNDFAIRRRVLGLPLCSTDNSLLVLRPDGKGSLFLVKYHLP